MCQHGGGPVTALVDVGGRDDRFVGPEPERLPCRQGRPARNRRAPPRPRWVRALAGPEVEGQEPSTGGRRRVHHGPQADAADIAQVHVVTWQTRHRGPGTGSGVGFPLGLIACRPNEHPGMVRQHARGRVRCRNDGQTASPAGAGALTRQGRGAASDPGRGPTDRRQDSVAEPPESCPRFQVGSDSGSALRRSTVQEFPPWGCIGVHPGAPTAAPCPPTP